MAVLVVLLIFPDGRLVVYGTAVAAQVQRFRRSTDPAARQQTKWLVPLTAILAGGFTASVTSLRSFLDALTGGSSDATAVLSSLIVMALLTPVVATAIAEDGRP